MDYPVLVNPGKPFLRRMPKRKKPDRVALEAVKGRKSAAAGPKTARPLGEGGHGPAAGNTQ